MGGLGLRGACHHASTSYASSVLSTASQSRALQGRQNDPTPVTLSQDVLDDLTLLLGEESTVEVLWGLSQKALSLKVDLKRLSILQNQVKELGSVREVARLASLGLHHAGSWLMVTPTPALGLHLQPTSLCHGCEVPPRLPGL